LTLATDHVNIAVCSYNVKFVVNFRTIV